MTVFKEYVRTIIEAAASEAQAENSATIEAQHVLLAIAAQPETKSGQFLWGVGLNPGSLRAALKRELEHSLNAAGASLHTSAAGRPHDTAAPTPGLGPSVRQALERGVAGVQGGPQPAHLLFGILQADIGIVPRALELAGYHRPELLAQARRALAED